MRSSGATFARVRYTAVTASEPRDFSGYDIDGFPK
jgi:hypothetical protein